MVVSLPTIGVLEWHLHLPNALQLVRSQQGYCFVTLKDILTFVGRT